MRTVVTGGAGFIGSHLTEHLLAAGDVVTVLDDLSTGRLTNLDNVADHPSLTFVEGSVLDSALVEATIAGADRVFHLAAAVGVHVIVDAPLRSMRVNLHGTENVMRSMRVNLHGTENVLEAALRADARVLLASTSEIYGKNTADALAEDADRILGSPLVARWTYAAAKGIDEAFAHAYWRSYGLQVAIVRLFNTVGPRQVGHYGMVVPRLVAQALRGDPLTVYGDGQQTRCFSFVEDVVPAMVALEGHPEAVGRAVNLGGTTEISIMNLARRAVEVLGSSSEIVLVPYEEAYGEGYEDMRRRVPDNRLAGALVGFAPETGVDEIIRRVAEAMVRGGAAVGTG